MKILKFIFLLLALFHFNIIYWAETQNENKWDLWLVAPLNNDWITCYVWNKDDWTTKFLDIIDPSECAKKNWIIVQKLEDANNTNYSAIWLLNRYLSLLLNVIMKLWIIISMWFIVAWWIMMSKAWGSEDKNKWWKDKLIWWIASLLVIILWWIILHTINPLFYVW